MIDLQIAERERRTGPPRWRRLRSRGPRLDVTVAALRSRPADVVALYAEANAWPVGSGHDGEDELLQLLAVRPATGERFEAVLVPRRPLGPGVATHLELPVERLLAGEPAAAALARFSAFVRPDDLFCAWGPYALGLLRAEGAPERDLRRPAAGLRAGAGAPAGGRRAGAAAAGERGAPAAAHAGTRRAPAGRAARGAAAAGGAGALTGAPASAPTQALRTAARSRA